MESCFGHFRITILLITIMSPIVIMAFQFTGARETLVFQTTVWLITPMGLLL